MFGSNLHIKKFKLLILTLFLLFILSSEVINGQNVMVRAKKGDGIYKLLKRHKYSYAVYKEEFILLNQSRLAKGNRLIAGQKYKLPTRITNKNRSGDLLTYSLFGSKYANVKIKNQKLNGAIYYLVAGHGGPDPGALGIYGKHRLAEDEYAYDVTLRLARNLMEHGAKVYMIIGDKNDGIRDEKFLSMDRDEYCHPGNKIPLNQVERLKQRTKAVNNLYLKNRKAFQRMIIIHIDSRSRGKNIDVFFYHDKRSKTGKKAATILQKTFENQYKTHQPNRGYKGTVSTRNLYVVRKSYPPAIFIELGNINHRRDQKRFLIADNRQALANWLTEGLVSDFKNNK